jgi:hypothetical protein
MTLAEIAQLVRLPGRIAYLTILADDADRISRVLAKAQRTSEVPGGVEAH